MVIIAHELVIIVHELVIIVHELVLTVHQSVHVLNVMDVYGLLAAYMDSK